MDYEVLIKILGILLSSGVVLALSRVIICYIRRHDNKRIVMKLNEIEITFEGYTSTEANSVIKKLPKKKEDSQQKNLKSVKEANLKLIKD